MWSLETRSLNSSARLADQAEQLLIPSCLQSREPHGTCRRGSLAFVPDGARAQSPEGWARHLELVGRVVSKADAKGRAVGVQQGKGARVQARKVGFVALVIVMSRAEGIHA